jgi:hypothetical protein
MADLKPSLMTGAVRHSQETISKALQDVFVQAHNLLLNRKYRVSRERDGLLVGGGAAFTLIILLVLQSFIGSGLLSTRTGTSTVTSTLTIQPPLDPVVYQWAYYLGARDLTNLTNMYAQNATVTWTGEADGLKGTYGGVDNIGILFRSAEGKVSNLTATIGNDSLVVINPTETNATFSLTMHGTSPVQGNILIKANVSQEWNYSAVSGTIGQEQWQIVKENWNYTTYNIQYPVFG